MSDSPNKRPDPTESSQPAESPAATEESGPNDLKGAALRAAPISRGTWSGLALVGLLNVVVLAAHIFSHDTIHSIDGMYHIRYAWLYWQQGIFTDFPWMQFSIAQDSWADHHFLYHLLLIPFTRGDLLFGMKLSAVVFGACALTACTAYLVAHRVRYAWVYGLILLLASDVFLFRVSMARSISLSLIFLLLALWCLERRHHRTLFAVAFLYIWAYQTAIVLLPMACVAVILWRRQEGVWELRPLLYAVGGLVIGMALHPFVPSTFSFFFFHMIPAFPGQSASHVTQIVEWGGTTITGLWTRNYPTMVMGLLLPLLALRDRERWPQDIGILLVGTAALLLVSLKAERLLEYGVPFAVLLGARLFDAIIVKARSGGVVWPTGTIKVVVGLSLLSFVCFGALKHRDFHRHAFDVSPQLFRGAARWLKQNTPAKTVVYHTDWAGFSYLFFHNVHNRYLAGLSPLFMAAWKPKLYRAYQMINTGQTRTPAKWIRKLFRSRYVVLSSRRGNRRLAMQLMANPQVKEVYSDARVKIFRLDG